MLYLYLLLFYLFIVDWLFFGTFLFLICFLSWIILSTFVAWKIQCKLPPKTKAILPP